MDRVSNGLANQVMNNVIKTSFYFANMLKSHNFATFVMYTISIEKENDMKAREQSKLEKEILEKCWYVDDVFGIGQSPQKYEKFLRGIGGITLFQQMSAEAFELFKEYDVMMWMNQSRKRRKWKRYQR